MYVLTMRHVCADYALTMLIPQGGYFIINGGEKVLIAQERMANNHVYVFKRSQPSKYSFSCECRSVVENSTRSTSSMSINMLSRASAKQVLAVGGTLMVGSVDRGGFDCCPTSD